MGKLTILSNFQPLDDFYRAVIQKIPAEISEEALTKVQKCRDYLDNKINHSDAVMYGINTGFGSLCNTIIDKSQLATLQKNLILSHACGLGDEIPSDIVRLMLLLKIKSLAKGHSGIRVETIKRLLEFYNHDLIPVVYEQGSLGASGDLSPLAHMALPLIGKGEVHLKGEKMPAELALKKLGLAPINLEAKEGLALLNGTQFMSAYAVYILGTINALKDGFVKIASLSVDAFDCSISPFDKEVNEIRNHRGQKQIAETVRTYLSDSEIIKQTKKHVQDPYSFRCIPQVLGASLDALYHAADTVNNEINAVTDNPTIFVDSDKVVSAGNFHGQPIAIQLDILAIALAEWASIAERRVYQLVNGKRGLPDFLTPAPGLNSGFMIIQYTAASIVSQSKQLTIPASTDSIDSSNGQEDHVSMGANAATKALRVLNNTKSVMAIELLVAAQALEFRRPLKSGSQIEKMLSDFRKEVPFIESDVEMHNLLKKSTSFIEGLLKFT